MPNAEDRLRLLLASSSALNTEGQAFKGLSLSYSYLLSSKCNRPGRTMSNRPRLEDLDLDAEDLVEDLGNPQLGGGEIGPGSLAALGRLDLNEPNFPIFVGQEVGPSALHHLPPIFDEHVCDLTFCRVGCSNGSHTYPLADLYVQSQVLRQDLPTPYIVGYGHLVLGAAHREMGVQVQMKVSWEEVEPAEGLHPHGELWVRVLSEKPMEATLDLPREIASQITPEILAGYNDRTVCDWHPDLREDDDETIPEWPYEQWWALPKMRVIA